MAKAKSMGKTKAAGKPARTATKAAKPTAAKRATKPAKAMKAAQVAAAPPLAARTVAVPAPRAIPPAVPPALRPAPPPPRDEMIAPRDIARLTRYGERFGAAKIDVKMLPMPLPVASGAIAVCDPAAPKSWRVFDRPVGGGQFRTMLSVACGAQGAPNNESLAAVVVHVGRPPIAKWTVAHFAGGKKPKSIDQLPRVSVTSGWLVVVDGSEPVGEIAVPAVGGVLPIEVPLVDGRRALALPCGDGEFAAYWAVDAADKPICLVLDFDRFSQKDWKARPVGV